MKTITPLLLLSLVTLTTLTHCAKESAEDSPPPRPAVAEAPAAQGPPRPAVAEAPAPAPAPTRSKDDIGASAVRVPIDGLPAFGDPRALVTLVAFTDYECPYCAKADTRIATLRAEYGERLRVVIATHPLAIHDQAPAAARAFLAAVEQGKGEAMHARLFALNAASTPFDDDNLRAAAKTLGLDVPTFDRARHGASTEGAVHRAELLAAKLDVSAAPTFFVNGRRLVGARPIEAFRALIEEELATARTLEARGVGPEGVYGRLLATLPDADPPKGAPATGPEAVLDVDIEGAPVRGRSHAPVTIVFFSDFECPYCVKAEGTLRAIEAAEPGKVKIAFRQRPLPIHPHARLAAKASLAAERQNRFWEYHDVLLRHRDALEREDLERYASELGLDRARFTRDLDDPAIEARVAADLKQAEALDVKGTPTAFVNGRRITGAQPLSTWLGLVERAAARP
ncbi:MAG TPA: thioredoxin domain-containing protein [Labilithrix sp.]|nr:thioredoxin domain-containing protein [Labilithrix sp.]